MNQPNKESFIKAVTDGLLPPPGYFGMNVAMNKQGYASFDKVLNEGTRPLTVEAFEAAAEETGALVLDTRDPDSFFKGYIPQSVNIGLSGDFAPWVGALIVDVNQPLLLVCNEGKEEEAVTRLSRVGFDHVIGFLSGGYEAWLKAGKPVDTIERINAQLFEENYDSQTDQVIDIRRESEFAAEHIENAYNKPLSYINDWIKDIDPKQHFYALRWRIQKYDCSKYSTS